MNKFLKVLSIILIIPVIIIDLYFSKEIINEFDFSPKQPSIELQYSQKEIEIFNDQFEQFTGEQKGTNLKSLIGKLIANANTNEDESKKLPDLVVETKDGYGGYVISDIINYNTKDKSTYHGSNINGFNYARNYIESTHFYYVCVEKNPKTGFVDLIFIAYQKGDFDNFSEDYDEYGNIIDLSRYGGTAFGEYEDAKENEPTKMIINREENQSSNINNFTNPNVVTYN